MQQVTKREFAERLVAVRDGTYSEKFQAQESLPRKSFSSSFGGELSLNASRTIREAASSLKGTDIQDHFDYKYPTVAEKRGPNSIANIKPAKNIATSVSELSLPIAQGKHTVEKANRTSSEITKLVQKSVKLTGESIFAKDKCSTTKGWCPGKFS